MGILRRWILAGFALMLAIPAGALVLGAGVLLDPVSREVVGSLGLVGFLSGLSDLASGLPPDLLIAAFLAFARALCVLLVVPPLAAAVIGEVFGWRSAAAYGAASGLVTALLPLFARGGVRPPSGAAALAAEGRVLAILFVAGAASGLVYGWIASRDAGRESPRSLRA